MLKKLKNFIVDKKLYWKLRHLISPNLWENYYENSVSKRRDFYSEFIQKKNIKNGKKKIKTNVLLITLNGHLKIYNFFQNILVLSLAPVYLKLI